ncbi:SDR family oxidoreductase [Chitinophaga sp. Ak27]|nr:SDR family oxidoreductase [Chitinophaga sp. Ak27]
MKKLETQQAFGSLFILINNAGIYQYESINVWGSLLAIQEGSHAAGFIGSDAETKLVATTPLGRTGQPEDIAKVAVFLASDDAAWSTGEKISVSGGIYGI